MPKVNYIIDGELYHDGIKGQKWGKRRYQYEDGSLTPEGRRRYYGEAGQRKFHFGDAKNERIKSKENIEKEKIRSRQKTKENIAKNKLQTKENIQREKIKAKANVRKLAIKAERDKQVEQNKLEQEKVKRDEVQFVSNSVKEVTPVVKDLLKELGTTAIKSAFQSLADVKKDETRAIIEKNSKLAFNKKYDKKAYKKMQQENMKDFEARNKESYKTFMTQEMNKRKISDISSKTSEEGFNFIQKQNKISLVDLGLDKLDKYDDWEKKK